VPRHVAIERALRDAIVDGRLAPGAHLPSTRALAAELGVARGTVVSAFEQLTAEGLLDSRQGAPTRVAHVPPRPAPPEPPRRAPVVRADFFGGDPDLTLFPRAAWRAAVATVLATAEAGRFGYGDPAGEPELRAALVEYLGRTRGVVARREHVVVTAGFTHSLAVLGRALITGGHAAIAVEDPSYWRHREMLAAAGLRCEPVSVDTDGLRVDELAARGSRAVLVTPAHHTPLGVSLAAGRRTGLVGWAAARDGIIIEDDYDGELRFDRRPLRAIQSLDPDHVVYCGSASKSLAPGMRMSWCVLPAALVEPTVAAMTSIGGQAVSRLDQLVLAELFTTGRYDAQVRRIRADYRRRRDDLIAAVAARVPAVRVEGLSAGLKALLRLPPGTDEAAVVAALGDRGVAVASLEAFRTDPAAIGGLPPEAMHQGPALVVNYAQPFAHQYRTALALLVDSLADVLGERGAVRPDPAPATRPAGRTSGGVRTPARARSGRPR
jgi:GntR family transcriptional regulator/MocR family aminotransferase